MIGCVGIFTLGSGISGGATNGSMLIAGRAIQGLGSGGLNMLIDLIICDLVSLRERGKYIGLISIVFALGVFVGPFVGGSLVQHSSWRWVFYINLPIGGASMVMLFLFLRVNHKKLPLKEKISRIDWIGNLLIVLSTLSILFALTYAGTDYAWSSFNTLIPLILGFAGMTAFHTYEASRFCKYPTVPRHLFTNRTSAIAFFLTFIHALLTLWVLYFLPVYFQASHGTTPSQSGLDILPTVLALVPAAGIAGFALTRFGRYRPLHIAGFVFMVAGLGSFTVLKSDTPPAVWIIVQTIQSFGSGLIITALLPAVQAELTDDDNASSTATWAYVRSYGAIWGVTIPAVIFNNVFTKLLPRISDPVARQTLASGNAYAYASRAFVYSFPAKVRDEIVSVFADSLKITWIVATAIAGVSFLLAFLEKEVPLRESLRTEFGIKEPKGMDDREAVVSISVKENGSSGP
jgi:MFS family permease